MNDSNFTFNSKQSNWEKLLRRLRGVLYYKLTSSQFPFSPIIFRTKCSAIRIILELKGNVGELRANSLSQVSNDLIGGFLLFKKIKQKI